MDTMESKNGAIVHVYGVREAVRDVGRFVLMQKYEEEEEYWSLYFSGRRTWKFITTIGGLYEAVEACGALNEIIGEGKEVRHEED